VVLHEPVTLQELAGLALALLSIVLIAGGPARR
jgi:drug/metabolite transporter (DMT)-like permease